MVCRSSFVFVLFVLALLGCERGPARTGDGSAAVRAPQLAASGEPKPSSTEQKCDGKAAGAPKEADKERTPSGKPGADSEIPERELTSVEFPGYRVSLKYPKGWRAHSDNDKAVVNYFMNSPPERLESPVASVGVSRPWAEEPSLAEWKKKREKEQPLYSVTLLSQPVKGAQRRFESIGAVTILYWDATAKPNWLLNLDKSIKELTLHVIEIAQVDGGKVTSTMIWASYPSDSAQRRNEARAIVGSMKFDDLKQVTLKLQ